MQTARPFAKVRGDSEARVKKRGRLEPTVGRDTLQTGWQALRYLWQGMKGVGSQ